MFSWSSCIDTPTVMRNFLQLVSDRTLFLSKAECLCPAKPEIAHTELSTHAWHDTQPAGSGTNTGVARPSLARALSELASEGCIRIEEKEMRINEISAQKYL